MIKTFVYNELNFPRYNINLEQAYEDIETFIHSGGNLNLPIKYDNALISAFTFFEEHLSVDFVTQLFEKNYLNSPANWVLDEKNKTIIQCSDFQDSWYRKHSSKYRNIIANGFRKLCQQYLSDPIYTSLSYINDSDQNITQPSEHPLLDILIKIPHKEVLEVFLQEIPNAKELLTMTYYKKVKSHKPYYECITDANDHIENLSLLFKYDVLDIDVLIRDYNFNELIEHAIWNNDIDFIHLVQSKSHDPHYLGQLDKDNAMYDSFLRRAVSPEMAKILIDSGCPVIKNNSISSDCILFSYNQFPASKLNTIKFIMEYVPLDYMGKYKDIFWGYLSNSYNLEEFKDFAQFIIAKGFPVEQYDLFNACPADDVTTQIKTCLDLGANRYNCKDLIASLVNKRDVSKFKAIQKTTLIDLLSPDGIYYFLQCNNHTKTTFDLLEKADIDNINALTSFGKPAWFGANSKETVQRIIKKVYSFNQTDSDNNNWITHYYSSRIKEKNEIAPIVLEMSSREESNYNRLLVLNHVENTSNLLHYGFTLDEYQTKELKEEFIRIIKSFDISYLPNLLSGLNEKGLFPIDYLIASKNEDGVWNKSSWDAKFDQILKLAEYNVDYDKKNINGNTLIHQIRSYYKINDVANHFIDPVEKAYLKYQLYNKLDNKLVSENKKSSIVKI